MKRWVLLAAVLVVLTSAVTIGVQYVPTSVVEPSVKGPSFPKPEAPLGPKPKAVVEGDKTYDFGTLPQRATGKHAWLVKNEGEADLELWMISSTCSCTLAKFKDGGRATVKPGASTEIVLEYETRENNGEYSKGAEIGTNDPELPQFPLYVHGRVFPAVMTIPPGTTINMLTIPNDVEDHVQDVGVYSLDKPDLKILEATTSNPKEVEVTLQPMTEEECRRIQIQHGTRVSIHVKSGLPLGVFKEEVVLTTDHPKEPELRLSVVGKMTGPINLVPGMLTMHQVNGKVGAHGEVVIAVRAGRETRFSVEKGPTALNYAIVPERKGRYRLSVTVPPGTPAQEIEDEVVLKTDHPRAEKVIVPLSLWIQSAP